MGHPRSCLWWFWEGRCFPTLTAEAAVRMGHPAFVFVVVLGGSVLSHPNRRGGG